MEEIKFNYVKIYRLHQWAEKMIRRRKILSVVNCLYDEKKVNLLPGGISALHHASKPSMKNYQKVTFPGKLLFSVVLPGVVLMQLTNPTTDIILAKHSTYLKEVSFPQYNEVEVE